MNKLKIFSVRCGIIFLLTIAFLTYFSDTIDYMLLPKVKVATVEMGAIEGATTVGMKQKYLLPLSAVIPMGEDGSVFIVQTDMDGDSVVERKEVKITNSDDLYYEVTGDMLYSGMEAVYNVSKPIEHGDRVYVEE